MSRACALGCAGPEVNPQDQQERNRHRKPCVPTVRRLKVPVLHGEGGDDGGMERRRYRLTAGNCGSDGEAQ